MLAFFSNRLKNWWENSVVSAPPANRDLTVSYVLLKRIKDNQAVGSFIPEFYELASAGSLRCQREEKEWLKTKGNIAVEAVAETLCKEKPELFKQLYIADGSRRKTAFELAVFPSQKNSMVLHAIEREYRFRQKNRLRLPRLVSKFIVEKHYLRDLEKAGLQASTYPIGKKVNISVGTKASLTEKLLHYTGQWLSLFVSFSLAVAAVDGLGLFTSPWAVAWVMLATYMVKRTGNDFGFYDLAEAIHRDVGWLFSKELATGMKLSPSKTLSTLLYLSAILTLAVAGAVGIWGALLPVGAQLATGLNTLATTQLGITLSESALAFVPAIFAGLNSAAIFLLGSVGGLYPVHYFKSLEPRDTQVDFITQNTAPALPVVNQVSENRLKNEETLRQMRKHKDKHPEAKEYGKLIQQLEGINNELTRFEGKFAANDAKKQARQEGGGRSTTPAYEGRQAVAAENGNVQHDELAVRRSSRDRKSPTRFVPGS